MLIIGIASVATLSLATLCFPATAQSSRIICIGVLTEAETPTSAWPLGIIHDADGHYICTIDRNTAGHDPLSPCSAGHKCRVIGTFHKVGQTYSIEKIISIGRVD